MKVAVVGCTHGDLDGLYKAVEEVERAQSVKVDLIVCPGDFQAARNLADLQSMACPPKFKDMRSFWKYYAGEKTATIPTLFVGGNHEASNHLQEIPLGGLVAPNIYYVGNAGVVNFRGLRIAGVSGVYVEHNYNRKRMERPPYQNSDVRTVYHARREDMERLLRIKRPVDICISHDWPRGITDFGDSEQLLKAKPFLKSEILRGSFGNPGTMQVLQKVQPRFWFAAHMHVKFPAIVTHGDSGKRTKFLALDKILPRRDFVQLLDIPVEDGAMSDEAALGEQRLELDPEWLSILHTEANEPGRTGSVSDQEIAGTVAVLQQKGVRLHVDLVSDFARRAEMYNPNDVHKASTQSFCIEPRNVELFAALKLSAPPDYALLRYPPADGEEGKSESAKNSDASMMMQQ